MAHWLEFEEMVGRCWHQWASRASSYPRYPEAEVKLDDLSGVLSIFFRATGGEAGLQLAAIAARGSLHRLAWRQRLGLDRESLDVARRDEEQLLLPPGICLFPTAALNRDLYFWLTAFLAHARPTCDDPDPLRRDIYWLRESVRTTAAVLGRFPGLVARHDRLSQALLEIRPQRRLPAMESALESVIRSLLGDRRPLTGAAARIHAALLDPHGPLHDISAPARYRPPLPVPLWARAVRLGTVRSNHPDADNETLPEGGADAALEGKRQAERRRQDQSERRDSLIFNRFEKMLSFSEMVNLNRMVDDEEDENARDTADQMEELTLSPHQQRAASKLRIELDLAPGSATGGPVWGRHSYPEWNYRTQTYLPDHCVVLTQVQSEEGDEWTPAPPTLRRIRRVRREFEALRPRREVLRGQLDGSELDMDATIRAHCDLAATGEFSDRLYLATRCQARDLAVSILVDVSLSTDAWLENERIIDVEKEALLVLCHGLAGCGDDYAVQAFSSQRRQRVWVHTLKAFDEAMTGRVDRRITALKPGHYTRIGPAIRHVAGVLAARPNRHRLLLVLTDGKPNDSDYYEGRYGIEDTRRAILDARQQEVKVFGVTIDNEAQQYIARLFGRGGYAIVQRPEHLSQALPGIYRQIIAG